MENIDDNQNSATLEERVSAKLTKNGINANALRGNHPEVFNYLMKSQYDSNSCWAPVVCYDEPSGVVAVGTDQHWYEKDSAYYRTGCGGGVGMSKIVTVKNPQGKCTVKEYVWRDQYNPANDRPWLSFNSLAFVRVEGDVVTLQHHHWKYGDTNWTYTLK